MTPSTSLRNTSFSALSFAAIAEAATSALILCGSQASFTPIGAITGMMPLSRRRFRYTVLTPVTSPTKPRSTPPSADLFTFKTWASIPQSPTASPSCLLILPTMSLFVFPASTIWTTSIIGASVYRWPFTKRDSRPSFEAMSVISFPPPWTIATLMPIFFRRVTSWANASFNSSSTIAAPPYFTTKVFPSYREIYGSASIRTSVLAPSEVIMPQVR